MKGVRGEFRSCSLGVGDQGFFSLLGILEQSRLRCLSVVRFFLLGNKGQGPSLGMGGGKEVFLLGIGALSLLFGINVQGFVSFCWGPEPLGLELKGNNLICWLLGY